MKIKLGAKAPKIKVKGLKIKLPKAKSKTKKSYYA